MKNLIIVESPTKARTFNKLLHDKDTEVFATMGHIRDLPKKKLGIDYKENFKPTYVILDNKKKIVSELKKLKKNSDTIYLATDPDREGESIAYHVAWVLGFVEENWPEFELRKGDKKIKRIVFHEITKEALENAIKNPTEIRSLLVKAQQARRILDRVVGYELSPLLWKKMGKYWLSAGRVQTVALRLIVEREKEIRSFKKEPYAQIYGVFKKLPQKAKLKSIGGKSVEKKETKKLFVGSYTYTSTTLSPLKAKEIAKKAKLDEYFLKNIVVTQFTRTPFPPLTTSLMQQEAYSKLGFSSRATMRLAQNLYEAGLITYHRTDSFNLSNKFIQAARSYIKKRFTEKYLPKEKFVYKTKSKNAQEAHEAIRPTQLKEIQPSKNITRRHVALYNLIFRRAVASQMKPAQLKNIKLEIESKKFQYLFATSLQKIVFSGFLKLLSPQLLNKDISIPELKQGENIELKDIEVEEKETKPPPRYNDASLIKTLEAEGIGRPSTYAPIITLIQQKRYVEKEERYFIPTILGEKISDYLSESFPDIFNINFTAKMEDGLDNIAQGKENMQNLLTSFYRPFKNELEEKKRDTTKIKVFEETDEKCPKCGAPLVIKFSRFGKFYACSNFPSCKFTKPFIKYVKDVRCPECGGRIVIRYTKKGKKFYGCENYSKCKFSTWKLSEIKKIKK